MLSKLAPLQAEAVVQLSQGRIALSCDTLINDASCRFTAWRNSHYLTTPRAVAQCVAICCTLCCASKANTHARTDALQKKKKRRLAFWPMWGSNEAGYEYWVQSVIYGSVMKGKINTLSISLLMSLFRGHLERLNSPALFLHKGNVSFRLIWLHPYSDIQVLLLLWNGSSLWPWSTLCQKKLALICMIFEVNQRSNSVHFAQRYSMWHIQHSQYIAAQDSPLETV